MNVPLNDSPSLGDMEAAFVRMMKGRAANGRQSLADAVIVRDWITRAVFCMRSCFTAQTGTGHHLRCDTILGRLLDDRQTTGRPDAPPIRIAEDPDDPENRLP